MRVHKRKKTSRLRGSRTAGWGFRQKHKGHGNKGGVGMAGSGKKADHKKQTAISSDPTGGYFGRKGITSRSTKKKKYDKINLSDIKDNLFQKEGQNIDLSKHRILGGGDGFKATIKAKSATFGAINKMEKAGGKILFPVIKEGAKHSTVKDMGKKGDEGKV